MTLSAKYLGANGWLLTIGTMRIVVDPWLKGDLILSPFDWLIKGQLKNDLNIPKNIDLILLTQGIADHAHPETLDLFPKDMMVVASEKASSISREIGFTNIKVMKHGQELFINELIIKATEGAPVPHKENGYIIQHPQGSLYMEPHGFLDKSIKHQEIDTLITPVVDISLPFAGSFIKGKTVLPELIDKFNPLTILSSTTGGDSVFTGMLNSLFKVSGDVKEIPYLLPSGCKFINSVQAQEYELISRSYAN